MVIDMKEVNLIVMGKTGAGKSTLINAVLGRELAPTGTGGAVTKEVHIYSKTKLFRLPGSKPHKILGRHKNVLRKVNLYDTVGLEIDRTITEKTLADIREILNNSNSVSNKRNITLVWFCISAASSRFEKYEAELIRDLSVEYEIPFVIVLTQCFSIEHGEIEQQIDKDLSEITTVRVLAKDYRTSGGVIPAFGVDNLLCRSITEYSKKRVYILQAKLNKLLNGRAEELKQRGNVIIEKFSKKASKIGLIPIASIPFVHGLFHEMICDLNDLYGVNAPAEEYISNMIMGIILTPFMAVPLISSTVASAYIEALGEEYLKALSAVESESFDMGSDIDISRVYEELQKQQKEM
jgi:GTP-binding protein EngB required for normal cell division